MLKAYFFGTSAIGDAFQIAFLIPNLFRRLTAEGVMLTTFMAYFSSTMADKGEIAARRFFNSIFWFLLIFLSLFCVAFVINADFLVSNIFASGLDLATKDTAVFLAQLMFVYILFVSISALFQGLLNYHGQFIMAASTPIFFNVTVITLGLSTFWLTGNAVLGLTAGTVLGGLFQALILLPAVYQLGYGIKKPNIEWSFELKKMLKDTLPGILGTGIYQIDIVVSNAIATHTIAGGVIALSFSNRIIELALGVFVVSQTTVLLPAITKAIASRKYAEIEENLSLTLRVISFIVFPFVFGVVMTSAGIVNLLFGYGKFDAASVQLTAGVLALHAPGMLAIGWNRAFVTAYQASKLFKTTMYYALATLLVNISLALSLVGSFSVAGIALASTIAQFFLCALLIFRLHAKTNIKIDWAGLAKSIILKHALTSIIMAGALFLIQQAGISEGWFNTIIQIIAGICIYLALNFILKTEELFILLRLIRKK